jgi:hypothetical protein
MSYARLGSGAGSANASVGPTGAPVPASATLVGGENPSGNLTALQTDASGNLFITPAAGSLTNVNLTQVGGTPITLGQKFSASSFPVVLASDETVPISAVALPLPAGASTSALQTSGNASLTSILANQTNSTQTTSVLNFPATQPISGTVTANQGTPNTIANSWPVEITDGTNILGALTHPIRIDPTGTTAQPVTGTFFQAIQPISGTVTALQGTSPWVTSVSNFPATQPISGTVIANAGTPTPLTVHSGVITVGLTAIRLTVSGSAPASTRVVLVGTPLDTTTGHFFIGASTVTSETGAEIVYGQPFIANNDAGDYWIISDTAAQSVGVMEQY